MIFDSREAADNYEEWMNGSLILFFQNVGEFIQSGIMYDGVVTPDQVKRERMLKLANAAMNLLDKLNDECDQEFVLDSCSKERWDLGMDIDELATKIRDIINRLEALE